MLGVRNFMPAQQYSLIYIWPEITERPARYWVKYGILSTKPGTFVQKNFWHYDTIWHEFLTSHGIFMSLLNHGNFKNLKEVILRSLKGCHLVKGQLLPMAEIDYDHEYLPPCYDMFQAADRKKTILIIITCYTAHIIRQ